MNRKKFLSSGAAVLATGLLPAGIPGQPGDSSGIIPPYLEKGDKIAITSPAGYITREAIQPAILQLESWGLKVIVGSSIGRRDFSFGGTDAERLNDLQQLIDEPSIKAILCARGGYGSIRLVDKLNWSRFELSPKWIIGFSDVTVLHAHVARNLGIASIHSKMCNSFPDDWAKAEPIQIETILSIRQAIMGDKMVYTIPVNAKNKQGRAEGRLIGGNLKTLETLAGSKSDIRTDDKLLFVEDTGEYLYSIDRMFWNLKRTGKLEKLAGLILGGFKIKADDPGEEFGRSLHDIVLEKVSEYKYPVCFDFPVGHQKNNFALKHNVSHQLIVNDSNCKLSEVR
ncbi:MAG: LD-carboxypeptidase [Chitinophagaceae bacterium]|nr:LD-carboxypeptidase [Chitinophagaceae bacterium]